MLIFIQRLIIFAIFFPSAHLLSYPLQRADFNTGETVYENNVQLSKIKGRLYKISSPDGERTFRMHDFLTMIGPIVEFATFGANLTVRCLFDGLTAAQSLYRDLKPGPQGSAVEVTTILDSSSVESHEEFPIVSTAIILIDHYGPVPIESSSKIITRGKIVVLRNRFHIIPEGYHTADMIFSCKHFNISSVLRFSRILLVVRLYEINAREFILMKFVLSFNNNGAARSFYNYVKQVPDCTDDSIDVPADFSPWK